MRRFANSRCVICGEGLSVHERARGLTCAKAACQQQHLRTRLQAEYELERRCREEAEQVQRRWLDAEREEAANPAPVVLLPVNEKRLGTLPEKRVRRFREYLMRSISQAAAQRYGKTAAGDEEPAGEARERGEGTARLQAADKDPGAPRVLGQACAACRGNCCSLGGEHAFLRSGEILNFMRRNPESRPRDVLDAYLARLGSVTYVGSCVYHGPDGCRLPRDMRSRTCNDYRCDSLVEIQATVDWTGSQRVFAVAAGTSGPVRFAKLDESGREELEAGRAPAATAGR